LNTASIASRPCIRAAGIALLAAAASLFMFTPSFVTWRGLNIPELAADPALNRAADALRQLQDPFLRPDSPTDRVIAWRLFFPLLGHALRLPPALYLALPHLGCLLVLFLVARILLSCGLGGWESLAATTIAATCSWFFVSTGWLAYFDSWYVLGLLLVAFSPGRRWAVAAILVAPWIDERFVLTLPLCLAIRARCQAAFGTPRSPRELRSDWALFGAALLPWVAVRLGAFALGHDSVTGLYLREQTPARNIRFYAAGLWQGLRWAWVFVLAWLARERRAGAPRAAALGLLLGASVAVNLVAANDLSRSVSIVLPAAIIGILLWHRSEPARVRAFLFAACGLNLVFPARHVVGDWTEPIFYWHTELDNARHPPQLLDPRYYVQQGAALNSARDPSGAVRRFGIALALDPGNAEALADRAVSYYQLGRSGEALADADRAVLLQPHSADALYVRGIVRAGRGDAAGGLLDLEQALRDGPPDWPGRSQALRNIGDLRTRLEAR